jgi:hypothetical protein
MTRQLVHSLFNKSLHTVEGAEGPEASHEPVLGVAEPQAKLQLHEQGHKLQDEERVLLNNECTVCTV